MTVAASPRIELETFRDVRSRLKVLGVVYATWILLYCTVGQLASFLPATDLTTALDRTIPLLPGFVWIYTACYVIPLTLVTGRVDGHRFNRVLLAFGLANLTAFMAYVIFPVTFSKPVLGGSVSDRLLSVHYAIDFHPVSNCAPSMHVATVWLVALAIRGKGIGRIYKGLLITVAVLITASTLFTKQHLLADAVTGLAWGFAAWWVAGWSYQRLSDSAEDPSSSIRRIVKAAWPYWLGSMALVGGILCFRLAIGV